MFYWLFLEYDSVCFDTMFLRLTLDEMNLIINLIYFVKKKKNNFYKLLIERYRYLTKNEI